MRVRGAIVRILISLAVGVTVCLIALLLALRTSTARDYLARTLALGLSKALVGEFELGAIDDLSWDRVLLRGLVVRDTAGRTVLRARRVEAKLNLRALWNGQLVLDAARVDSAWVSLHRIDDRLAIAGVFLPVASEPASGPPGEPFVLRVRRAAVHDVTVVALPAGLTVQHATAVGELSYSDFFRLQVWSAAADAHQASAPLGQLRISGGSLRVQKGEPWTLSCTLRRGADVLALRAHAEWGDGGYRSARAELSGRVSADGLWTPGLQRSLSSLGTGIEIHANAWLKDYGEQLGLTGQLETAAGTLAIEAGREHAAYSARLRSSAFDVLLALGAPSAPRASFDVSLDASSHTATSVALRARVHALQYQDLSLSDLELRGVVDHQSVRVNVLELAAITNAGGGVQLDVRAGFDGEIAGALAVHVQRLPSALLGRPVGPLRAGSVKASARGRVQLSSGALSLESSLDVDRVAAFGARMKSLQAALSLKGTLSRPVIDARASGRAISRGQVHIETLEASARGSARHYDVDASAHGPNGSADAHFELSLAEAEQRLHGQAQMSGWGMRAVKISAEEIRIRPHAISLRGVRAVAERGLLVVDGRVGLDEPSDLHLQLQNVKVASIARLLCASDACAAWPDGELSAELQLNGALEAPILRVQARGTDLKLRGTPFGAVRASLALDARHDSLAAELELAGSRAAEAHLELTGQLPRQGGIGERLRAASYDVALSGHNDLAALAELWRALGLAEPLLGKLDYAGKLHGTLEQPEGQLRLTGKGLSRGVSKLASAELALELSPARTELSATLTDELGPLASVVADVAVAPLTVVRAAGTEQLYNLPGSYRLRLSERKLSQLPLEAPLSVPATLAVSATWLTRAGAAPEGHVQADAVWLAGAEHGQDEAGATCPGFRGATVQLIADTQRSRVHAQLTGKIADRQVVRAQFDGDISGGSARDFASRLAGIAIAVDVQKLDLAALPQNCGRIVGSVSGTAKAVGLLGPAPDIQIELLGEGIATAGAKALSMALTAKADRAGAQVRMTGTLPGRAPALEADARLLWSTNGARVLRIDAQRSSAHVRLVEMPLALLAAASDRVASADGLVSADVQVDGSKGQLDAHGELSLENGALSLRDPVLRIDKLSGRLRFDPSGLHIEELRIGDQQGSLRLAGSVALRAWQPSGAKLSLSAHEMPLRSDAKVVAFVDGKLKATASLDQSPQRVQISLEELAVRLNRKQRTDVQQLAPNPDITYIGAETAEGSAPSTAPMTPVEVELVAEQPFWVRRDDLGFQLSPALSMHVDQAGARLLGVVAVQRGYLNLLGKGFTFERGELRFDGRQQNDPTVSLDAVHDLGNQETVTVRIRNRLSAPTLSFSTSVAGAKSDAEIMQLLVRGREGTAADTAQAQAAAALAALTSGWLGGMSGHQVGKYIPVLSVETGATSGTRLRAGMEGRELLPQLIRGMVEGVYLEGFVGVRNQGGQAQQTGGVLMELYFPKRIVGGGSWELPNHWTVELTWEP